MPVGAEVMAPVGTPLPCRGGVGVGSVLLQSAYSRAPLIPSAWGVDYPHCIAYPALLQAIRKILTPPLPLPSREGSAYGLPVLHTLPYNENVVIRGYILGNV